jgi:ABC-2 type transport system permease protein
VAANELIPDMMRTVSHVTPHAWAIDAFRDLTLRDKGLLGVVPQLGVLVGFALALLALATIRSRKSLVG